MSRPRTEAICHTLIFLLGTIVGMFSCGADIKSEHVIYVTIATVFFSFTQFKGLYSKKS